VTPRTKREPLPETMLPLKPVETLMMTMLAGGIEASSQRHDPGEDERRIYYRLTPFGRRVLTAEMLRLRDLVQLAETQRIIGSARA